MRDLFFFPKLIWGMGTCTTLSAWRFKNHCRRGQRDCKSQRSRSTGAKHISWTSKDHCPHECTAPVAVSTRPAQMWALASLTCPSQCSFLQLIASGKQISIFSEGEPSLILTCSSQVGAFTLMSIWAL